MYVKFIAHAGIAIFEDNYSVLIDPWFRDSTLENPLIEGINRKNTIKFQIPPAVDELKDFAPGAILLSHFHVHHAPFNDVHDLIENSRGHVILAHPDGYANKIVTNRFGHFTDISIRPTRHRDEFSLGPFHITALTHTVEGHLAWFVKSKTGSMLHIADGAANTNFELNSLHPCWDEYMTIHPDIVFTSAGRNSLRKDDNGRRSIIESGSLSPIQAARLIQKIRPRLVSTIGNHNHSFKRNRLEFIPELPATEEEFRWALSWLAPEVKYVPIRAGHGFSLGEIPLGRTDANTYL